MEYLLLTVCFTVIQWKVTLKWSPASRWMLLLSSQRPWNASLLTVIVMTVNTKTRKSSNFPFEEQSLRPKPLWWDILHHEFSFIRPAAKNDHSGRLFLLRWNFRVPFHVLLSSAWSHSLGSTCWNKLEEGKWSELKMNQMYHDHSEVPYQPFQNSFICGRTEDSAWTRYAFFLQCIIS